MNSGRMIKADDQFNNANLWSECLAGWRAHLELGEPIR